MNKTNASIYFSEAQLDQVTRAATRAHKSVSEYLRDIAGPWAASDLGERPAAPPTARPPATESAVVQAARLHGMKVTDYRTYAAEMQAREELGLPKLHPITERPPARATILPPPAKRGRAPAPKRTTSGAYRRAG